MRNDDRNVETLLCVGGPADGKRVELYVGQNDYVFYQVAEEIPISWPPSDQQPATAVRVRTLYLRQPWRGGDRRLDILSPTDFPPESQLAALIAGYKQPAPVRWLSGEDGRAFVRRINRAGAFMSASRPLMQSVANSLAHAETGEEVIHILAQALLHSDATCEHYEKHTLQLAMLSPNTRPLGPAGAVGQGKSDADS